MNLASPRPRCQRCGTTLPEPYEGAHSAHAPETTSWLPHEAQTDWTDELAQRRVFFFYFIAIMAFLSMCAFLSCIK